MNQNTVIYLERGFANITHKALMGYLDCSSERKHTFVHRERKTPGELTAFFSLQLASCKTQFTTPLEFSIRKGGFEAIFVSWSEIYIAVSFTIFATVTVVW